MQSSSNSDQNYSLFRFEVYKQSPSGKARLGKIITPNGIIETPAFVFCSTKASIRSVPTRDLKEQGTQAILANTYHLMVKPGGDLIEQVGGLHRFMAWNGPLFTDSGGYQIFSMRDIARVSEEGASFHSLSDGKRYLLTPERAIQLQKQLGSDLAVVLDECIPAQVNFNDTYKSMQLSHRWALRSLKEFQSTNNEHQVLYGVVHGGTYDNLREIGANFISNLPFFGHAVGGALGLSRNQVNDTISKVMSCLAASRPVHLLGIGDAPTIFHSVDQGVDTFDCTYPTRLARHGSVLVPPCVLGKESATKMNHLKNGLNLHCKLYEKDLGPIDPKCLCTTCRTYSRSYLHYLTRTKELLAHHLLTIHNIAFMNRLFEAIRKSILDDTFNELKNHWLAF